MISVMKEDELGKNRQLPGTYFLTHSVLFCLSDPHGSFSLVFTRFTLKHSVYYHTVYLFRQILSCASFSVSFSLIVFSGSHTLAVVLGGIQFREWLPLKVQ